MFLKQSQIESEQILIHKSHSQSVDMDEHSLVLTLGGFLILCESLNLNSYFRVKQLREH